VFLEAQWGGLASLPVMNACNNCCPCGSPQRLCFCCVTCGVREFLAVCLHCNAGLEVGFRALKQQQQKSTLIFSPPPQSLKIAMY
jgi:hypothetical protein